MRVYKKVKWEWIFLLFVFCMLTMWAVIAPLDSSPDESMRYDIVLYIMKHGKLPAGYDPEIIHGMWGTSYAFNPILSYMISAVFGMLVSLFTADEFAILIAARMVNVIFGTLTAWLTIKIGKRMFDREAARFFVSLVVFLPGAIFIHSYVNNDALALFSTAWIIYCWTRAVQEGWTTTVCVQLAVAMSLCLLSYYNAYGYLLCSAVFFVGMMMKCQEKQWDFKQMFKKGLLMLGIVFVLAGWWFIRNAILYDGDFLAREVSSKCAEMYAIDELKPSNHITPQRLGMSVLEMMLWQKYWPHHWLGTTVVSFIGAFGFLNIFMSIKWYFLYCALFGVGFLGNIWCVKKRKNWDAKNWMNICMVVAMIIPMILMVIYSYTEDFQAQGRYIMPSLLPMMYFIVRGFDGWFQRIIKKEILRTWFYRIASVLLVVSAILVYIRVYAPNYI